MKVLSRVFRGKFGAGLRRAFRREQLVFLGSGDSLAQPKAFSAFLRTLLRDDWVVYAKKPFGGPDHVLHYLARYTHRVAISNHRLVSVSDTDVAFRWKDYAHHSKHRVMTLTHEEFLRRFLLHVLPRGFPRIRHFGLFANRRRGSVLPLCRTLLALQPRPIATTPVVAPALWVCPCCQGPCALWNGSAPTNCVGRHAARHNALTARNSATLSLNGCGFGDALPDVCLPARNHCISCRKSSVVDLYGAFLTRTLILPPSREPSSCPSTIRQSAFKTHSS